MIHQIRNYPCSSCDQPTNERRLVDIATVDGDGDSDEAALCVSCAVAADLPVCPVCGTFWEYGPSRCEECEDAAREDAILAKAGW